MRKSIAGLWNVKTLARLVMLRMRINDQQHEKKAGSKQITNT